MNENIINYINAVELAKSLLKKEIINEEDYKKAERFFATKYNVSIKSIYRLITC